MASLTSLVVLAVFALLQSACAQSNTEPRKPSRHCTVRMFGERSDIFDMQYDLKPVHLDQSVTDFKVDDPDRPTIGADLVGQEIIVCTPRYTPKARVHLTSENSFDDVRVEVYFGGIQPQGTVYLTRHLKRAPGSNSILSRSDD